MLEYVNFYAYLHKRPTRTWAPCSTRWRPTAACGTGPSSSASSDHGEMGLAHGGMREKALQRLRGDDPRAARRLQPEALPRAVRTDALASTGRPDADAGDARRTCRTQAVDLPGRDLTPVIRDAVEHPGEADRDACRTRSSSPPTRPSAPRWRRRIVITQPAHIRCIREARLEVRDVLRPRPVATPQYELYDLANDPLELHNMANPASAYYDPESRRRWWPSSTTG